MSTLLFVERVFLTSIVNFDSLGLTDQENPYGVLPSLLSPSFGRAMGTTLADYVGGLLSQRRGKRNGKLHKLSTEHKSIFHGGERALIYAAIQEFLENFGLNGKACMLRAICEVHSSQLMKYGLFGEVIKLFFTASKSPFAELMKDYIEAEETGKRHFGDRNLCTSFAKDCPKSIFRDRKESYSQENEQESTDDDESENFV